MTSLRKLRKLRDDETVQRIIAGRMKKDGMSEEEATAYALYDISDEDLGLLLGVDTQTAIEIRERAFAIRRAIIEEKLRNGEIQPHPNGAILEPSPEEHYRRLTEIRKAREAYEDTVVRPGLATRIRGTFSRKC